MIAVYYIATGDYKLFFEDFYNSLHNFLPEEEKRITLITDGLEEYKDKVRYFHIDDYPWPINTLFKMHYIIKYFDEEADYHFYFNANSIILNNNIQWLRKDKLNLTRHTKYYTEDRCQACFFGGNTEIMKEACNFVINGINQSLLHRHIPWLHDESILYTYYKLHKNKCHISRLCREDKLGIVYIYEKTDNPKFNKLK